MTRTKIRLIIPALMVVFMLVLARAHPFGDAGLTSGHYAEGPIMENSSVPAGVRSILTSKCADCHSMETQTPLYGRFAPVSWLLERDIIRGRQAMNLDDWDHYSVERQQTLAAKIVQETKSHEMPLLQYRMIHWSARITDADVRTLSSWAHAQSGHADATDVPAMQGDASRGKMLFEKRCAGCHELTKNHEGPKLAGVYGRVSGSVGDYTYSTALKSAHIVWNDSSLDKWLTDPDVVLPGNNMDFLTPKPLERRDIIAYLKQNSAR